MLFGVPVTQFLDPTVQELASADFDTLKREIGELTEKRDRVKHELDMETVLMRGAAAAAAAHAADLARIDGRLEVLAERVPQFGEFVRGVPRKGDRRE
jgi:hypothetical protein